MLLLRDDVIREMMAGENVIDRLERILARPVEGGLELPARMTIEDVHTHGFLRLMPCIAYDAGYAGYKAMNFHPDHGVRYMIALIRLSDGELVALLDADWITAHRTAATAAIAVRHLAPATVETLTVLGSGTQARALLDATARVITPGRIVVYSPTAENREQFAADVRARLGIPAEAVEDSDAAVNAGDVVLSAFRAGAAPVIHGMHLREGALVCGISSVRPAQREVDMSVWETSRVFVDDLEHVRHSGDGLAATERGLTAAGNVLELWQLLRDPTIGRRSAGERLLFKSVGTAEQDIALAALVVERAQDLGVGDSLDTFPALRPIQSRRAQATDPASIR